VTASTQCFSQIPMTELNAMKFSKTFSELDPEMQEKFLDWHGENNAEPLFNQFRLFGGAYGKDYFDLRNTLRSVTCPSLVITRTGVLSLTWNRGWHSTGISRTGNSWCCPIAATTPTKNGPQNTSRPSSISTPD